MCVHVFTCDEDDEYEGEELLDVLPFSPRLQCIVVCMEFTHTYLSLSCRILSSSRFFVSEN